MCQSINNLKLKVFCSFMLVLFILVCPRFSFAVKKGYATPVEEITEDMARTIIDKMNDTIGSTNEYYFKCTPREFVNAWKNFNWSDLGYGQIYFENLFFTQYQENGGYDITFFNFPTDTSMKPVVPEITAKIPTIYGLNANWSNEIQKLMTTNNTSESPTYLGNYVKILYYSGQLRMYKGTGAEDLSNATPSWYKGSESSPNRPTTDGYIFYCSNMFSLIKEIDLYTWYKNEGYRTYIKNDNLSIPIDYEDDTPTNPGDNSGDNSGDNKTDLSGVIGGINDLKDELVGSGDGIENTGLIGKILRGLLSLFVPDEEFFSEYWESIRVFFNDKLGFLWDVVMFIPNLIDNLKQLVDSYNKDIAFTIPEVSVPTFMGDDSEIVILESFEWKPYSYIGSSEIILNVYDLYLDLIDFLVFWGLMLQALDVLKNVLGMVDEPDEPDGK